MNAMMKQMGLGGGADAYKDLASDKEYAKMLKEMGLDPKAASKGGGGSADELMGQLGLNMDEEVDLGDAALLAELDGMDGVNVSPRTEAAELK